MNEVNLHRYHDEITQRHNGNLWHILWTDTITMGKLKEEFNISRNHYIKSVKMKDCLSFNGK